ncbi:MAG: hypothetical protein ACI9KE_002701 [Polyangiales bacterium]
MPRIFLLVLLALTLACGDDSNSVDAATDVPPGFVDGGPADAPRDALALEACADLDDATLVRHRSVPGGRQVHLRLRDGEGRPLDASYAGCIRVSDPVAGRAVPLWAPAEAGPGATLIVAQWAPGSIDASRAFIDAFVAARPPDEQVAVWAWSSALIQVVPATLDRGLITSRLDTFFTADDAAPMDIEVMANEAAEEWEKIADDSLLGARSILFVAPELTLGARPNIDRDAITDHWIVAGGDGVAPDVFTGEVVESAGIISSYLNSVRDAGLAALSWCDNGAPLDLTFENNGFDSGDGSLFRTTIGTAAPEHIDATCDRAAALNTELPARRAITMTFPGELRAIYDQRTADSNTEPFAGFLQLNGWPTPAPVMLNYRGRSSLPCARKSFSVDLDGGDARDFVPASGSDEFYLVSMCLDIHYVNQINANDLLRPWNAWRIEQEPVEVRVDGESRGLYLFVEKIQDQMSRDVSLARAVIRRRTDIDGAAPDIKWSFDDDDGAAFDRYTAFLASFEGLSGAALEAELRTRLDLDTYLRWIAMMSLLENGDYVDEAYFIETEGIRADHTTVPYYVVHGWDADDLFSACHHSGRFAIDDPRGLLYCSEALIDHLMFADEDLYRLYAATLREVATTVTPELFNAVTDANAVRLLNVLDRDETAAAMVETIETTPAFATAAGARTTIESATTAIQAKYAARRALVFERLETYEASL